MTRQKIISLLALGIIISFGIGLFHALTHINLHSYLHYGMYTLSASILREQFLYHS